MFLWWRTLPRISTCMTKGHLHFIYYSCKHRQGSSVCLCWADKGSITGQPTDSKGIPWFVLAQIKCNKYLPPLCSIFTQRQWYSISKLNCVSQWMPCQRQLILWFSLYDSGHFWPSPFKLWMLVHPRHNPHVNLFLPHITFRSHPLPWMQVVTVYQTIQSNISILNLHPLAHNPIFTSKINILIHGFNINIQLEKQTSFLAYIWRNPIFPSLVHGGKTIHLVAEDHHHPESCFHFTHWHPRLHEIGLNTLKRHPGSQNSTRLHPPT